VGSVKIKLEDLDECVNRKTVVNLIYKIVPSLIGKKGKGSFYLFESSEESDSSKIIEESHGYQVRKKSAVSHKQ
jgi:hypothetical protein